MKICIVSRSTTYHFKSGGMETQLKNLINGLTKEGHEITVITTSFPSDKLELNDKQITTDGVSYYFIGDTTPGLDSLTIWEKFWLKLGFLKRSIKFEGSKSFAHVSLDVYRKFDNEKNFDILISQSTAARFFSKRDVKSKFITIIHGTISDEIKNRASALKSISNYGRFLLVDLPKWYFEYNTSNRKFFREVDSIVAVSEALKKSFIKDFPNLQDKVCVIYNGVDENKYTKVENSNDKRLRLLYVGRMDREKGVDLILEAANLLKNESDIKFKLIGKGVHVDEFKEYIIKNSLSNNVELMGEIDNEDLPVQYQTSDIFLFPSRRKEGHPMTISEALCSGLAVISTRSGGLSELFEDGVHGYFVANESVNDIVDKIRKFKNDESLLYKFKENAYKLGREKYSQSSMAKLYIKLFNK